MGVYNRKYILNQYLTNLKLILIDCGLCVEIHLRNDIAFAMSLSKNFKVYTGYSPSEFCRKFK